jgi:hypothetical protein
MKSGPSEPAGLIRTTVVTVLGVTLAAVPIALWVAWSQEIFFGVLAVGGLCVALFVLLVDSRAPRGEERSHNGGIGKRAELPDQFVAEIHRIFPLTYHHSRLGKQRFRRAMEKLRTLMPR